MTRSSGVRNQAVAGESGKRNLRIGTTSGGVISNKSQSRTSETLVIPKEYGDHEGDDTSDQHQPRKSIHEVLICPFRRFESYHCHGKRLPVLIWSVPYATSPSMMIASPFIKTACRIMSGWSLVTWKLRLTPVAHPLCLFLTGIEHRGDNHESWRDGAFTYAKEHAAREELSKVLRSGMAEERHSPHEDVDASGGVVEC